MMTNSTVEAVFENWVFRPLISLEFLIPEGQHLKNFWFPRAGVNAIKLSLGVHSRFEFFFKKTQFEVQVFSIKKT